MTVCFRRVFSFSFRVRADVLIGPFFRRKFGPLRMRESQLNSDAKLEQVSLAYSTCYQMPEILELISPTLKLC